MATPSSTPNKHGLKRYIEKPTRKKIREDAGYGCVVCGTLFCDYEHIEPEFHDAEEHDPEKMTLLCESCHGKVTGKRKSKRRVWEAKADPFCKKHNFTREEIDPSVIPTFKVGNNLFNDVEIILAIHGKPLIWLEPPEKVDEPFLVSAIFYDNAGQYIASINRNQFTSVLGTHDVWGEGTRIEIRPQKGMIGLTLNIEGDKPVHVERINMNYLGNQVTVNKAGQLTFGTLHLDNVQVMGANTAVNIGSIPSIPFRDFSGQWKKATVAHQISKHELQIINVNGITCGWVLGNCLINSSYEVVASHQDGTVTSLTGEYIGVLTSNHKGQCTLVNPSDEHDNYEPIWVSSQEKATKNIRANHYVDMTYRLFNIERTKRNPSITNPTAETPPPQQEVQSPKYLETNDLICNGDRVNIDFLGKINSIPFDGGSAKNHQLVIGEGKMLPDFEGGLIGKKVGDVFDIEVSFPSDYPALNLQGKKAVFTILINQIERYVQ